MSYVRSPATVMARGAALVLLGVAARLKVEEALVEEVTRCVYGDFELETGNRKSSYPGCRFPRTAEERQAAREDLV